MAGSAVRNLLPDDELLAGRYRLIEPLASGGMATVWRARDELLGRIVAVKALDARLVADSAARARMRIEAQALAQLTHPHIAHVYDYGTIDRPSEPAVPYLVMELVDGTTLAAMLADRGGALPWPAAVSACAQVSQALAAAHERGVVHRDITPANVLLTPAGVKVVDFGICAVEGERESDPDGNLVGTPAYLAPECIDDQPVAPASDVYALGVLLYRALSGRLPWPATSPIELIRAHRAADPDPLPAIAGLPDEVVEVCLRCLAKDPDDRPSAAEVADVLLATGDSDQLAAGIIAGRSNADATTVATHILAWPVSTGAVVTNRLRRLTIGRRLEIAVLAASVLLIGVGAWAATNWTPSADRIQPQAMGAPAPATSATPPRCQVAYQVTSDTGRHFTATITVTNIGEAVPDWRLTFDLPAQQRLDPHLSGVWNQNGRNVTSRQLPGPLQPATPVRLPFAGDYSATNPLPTRFWVNNDSCAVTILGPSGLPAGAVAQQARSIDTEPGDKRGKRKGKGKDETGDN